jgi:hypothetical protein
MSLIVLQVHIPARYATGYLGDIGVPASPDPMDFSAWFEVISDHTGTHSTHDTTNVASAAF